MHMHCPPMGDLLPVDTVRGIYDRPIATGYRTFCIELYTRG